MRARLCVVFLFCSLLCFASGCQKDAGPSASSAATTSSTPGAANSNQPVAATNTQAASVPSDAACAFLTKDEIKSVQKEEVKDAKGSERAENGMIVSQCFYTLNSFANSVSLQVTKTDPKSSAHRDPKDFWEQTFSKYEGEEAEKEGREREKEKEREKNKEAQKGAERRGESEEEEEGAPPKKINGIGDEAFWTGNRVGGALYVLKKNSFIRISIGGQTDEATKINKSKVLAKKALARL